MTKVLLGLAASAFFLPLQSLRAEDAVEISSISMTMRQYQALAVKKSLRAEILQDQLASSGYSRLSTLRARYMPKVTANSTLSRNVSNDDISEITTTDSEQGGVSLVQPLPLGTDLSLASQWSNSKSRYSSGAAVSRTRILPEFTGSLTQPLYIFTGNPRRRSKQRAELSWMTAQSSYDRDRLDISLDAKDLYYAALLRIESVRVEQAKFESAQRVHRITQKLVDAGRLAPVELSRADLRINRDARRIKNSESDLNQALTTAKNFVRLPQENTLVLTSKLEYKPLARTVTELIAMAQKQNHDLRNSERQITLAEIDLAESPESTRPSLELTGSYTYDENRSVIGVRRNPYSWSSGATVSWPLFDGTQTALQTKQREIALTNARRTYEESRRQIEVSVRNAFVELRRTEEQVREFEAQRRIAQSNLDAVRLQYQNGLARLIDAFDAENEQRDLELEYLNLLINYNRQRDALSRLVGFDLDGGVL